MIYERCKDILLREHELVQEAVSVHEKLSQAVISREWASFNGYASVMNEIENKLVSLEDERSLLFSSFEAIVRNNFLGGAKDDKSRFYTMVSVLPENQRNDLTAIYRSLKLETLKLRTANEALIAYMAGIKSTLKEFFEITFPDRAVKMYTKDGTHHSHDMRSMVLNQSF